MGWGVVKVRGWTEGVDRENNGYHSCSNCWNTIVNLRTITVVFSGREVTWPCGAYRYLAVD